MPSAPSSGLCGASSSANTAISAIEQRIKVGSTGNAPRRRETRGASGMASVPIAMTLFLQSDARIDHGIKDVDQQVDHHDHRPAQEHHCLHHREVAEGDALI